MTERVAVKLLQYYGGVNAGEIAGYVPEVAERLIAQGFAEIYVPDAEMAVDETDEPATMTPAERKALKKAATATLPVQGADA